MSEDKLQESISRGARAEALLQNDLLQEAFTRLEKGLYRRLENVARPRHRQPRAAVAGGQYRRQGPRSHRQGDQ